MRASPLVILAAAAVALASAPSPAPAQGKAPPAEHVERIAAALPDAAPATPKKNRTVLVFTLCRGYRHASIPTGVRALRMLGEKTGAFDVVASEDIAEFRRLDRYDGIVFLSTTGTLFDDAELRANLLAFAENGGGIVGIHAATDCFYDWRAFGEMMGGWFDGHPWHEKVTIRVEEPEHPVNACFPDERFTVTDEIYQLRDPYSRERLRVLLGLDTDLTDMTKKGIKRRDGDFAVSWVRAYGKGRVFYCSLGHRAEIFWNPVVLRHYLAGIQFALGDLAADAAPRPRAAHGGDDAALLAGLITYEPGDGRMVLSRLEGRVRAMLGDDGQRSALAGRLAAVAADDDATPAARTFACRQLALCGDAANVASLASLLGDERLAHPARLALERIPDAAAGAAPRDALATTGGDLRLGVIASIAARGDRDAVTALRRLAADDDTTRGAVLDALAKIGGPSALPAIRAIGRDAPPDVLRDALLAAAHTRAQQSAPQAAAATYRRLLEDDDAPARVQVAALEGLAQARPLEACAPLARWLSHDEHAWRHHAARIVITMPGGEPITQFFAALLGDQELYELSPGARVLLVDTLAARGVEGAAETLGELAANPDAAAVAPALRDAATRALGVIGVAANVPLLADLAAGGDETARASLHRLRAGGVDPRLADLLPSPRPEIRLEAARALGVRRATTAAAALIARVDADPDAAVRDAALDALTRVATPRHAPALAALLDGRRSDDDRAKIEASLVAACGREADRERRVVPIIAALERRRAGGHETLLRVLGRLGGARALATVRKAAQEGDHVDAAVEALGLWPDAAAVDDLFTIAERTSRAPRRASAFRGLVRGLGHDEGRDPTALAARYRRASALARTDEERALVLAGLGRVTAPQALALAEQFVRSGPLPRRAAKTVIAIAGALDAEHAGAARSAIDRMLARFPDDDELRSAAGEVVARLEADKGYLTAWRFAGPYTRDGVGGRALFGVAFTPETSAPEQDDVPWGAVPANAISAPGIVDLNTIDGGNDRVGYLLAEIHVPTTTEARLELGSDDGLKVWVNGELVHANDVMRGALARDRVDVTLRSGVNAIMLKINQGGGDWKACCRVRGRDGFAIEGMEER